MFTPDVIIAIIAGLPAIIAAVSSLINHGRLKRVSERTKRIETQTNGHTHNGAEPTR